MVPSLFLAHGVPITGLVDNNYTRFVRGIGLLLPSPSSVVIVTADGEGEALTIGAADKYEGIRMEYGFPDELRAVSYPARGHRDLASDIGIMCSTYGLPYRFNVNGTLDYRAWAALNWLYPLADVPVVTISVNGSLVPEEHYRIGRMLEPLRERGALIIGCGSTGYKLRKLSWDAARPERWATGFDDWLTEQAAVWNTEALFDYAGRAPYAQEAILGSGESHIAPLFVAMGAADGVKIAEKLHQSYAYGCLSLNVWMFGRTN